MSWRKVPNAAKAFVVVWLSIQLVVPLTRLTSDAPPERFVWRMFSTSQPAPHYTVTTPDAAVTINLADITARLRADLPFEEFVPQHLCTIVADAVAVQTPSGVVSCTSP